MFQRTKQTQRDDTGVKGNFFTQDTSAEVVNEDPAKAIIISTSTNQPATADPQVNVAADVSASMHITDASGTEAINIMRDQIAALFAALTSLVMVTFGQNTDQDEYAEEPIPDPLRGYRMVRQRVRQNPPAITRHNKDRFPLEEVIVARGKTHPRRIGEFINHPNPKIFVFIGDGAFSSDRPGVTGLQKWKEIAERLARAGKFRDTTHMVFIFPQHTKDKHRDELLNAVTQLLRDAGVGAQILTYEQTRERTQIVDVIRDISRAQRTWATPVPRGYTRVIDWFAFHPKLTARSLGNHMANFFPEMWFQLMIEMLRLAKQSPEVLINDPVWAKLHKAMVITSREAEHRLGQVGDGHLDYHRLVEAFSGYRDKMGDIKRNFPNGTVQRDALETLYTLSYRDSEGIQLLLDGFKPYRKACLGFLIHANKGVTSEAEIITVGRQRTLITKLVADIRIGGGWRFQRMNGDEFKLNPNGTFIGMPIFDYDRLAEMMVESGCSEQDARKQASKICRQAFSMMFAQWTPVPLVDILQWIVALSFIVRSETPMEEPIVNMVKATFFNDEEYTLRMLGLSVNASGEPMVDTDRRELLYYYPILKMVVEVLNRYRNEMFPNILRSRKDKLQKEAIFQLPPGAEVDDETGEVFIPPEPSKPVVTAEILLQQFAGFRKACSIFHILDGLKQFVGPASDLKITRQVEFVEEGAAGSSFWTYAPGDLVEFGAEGTTRGNKSTPWPALPCVGVVVWAGKVYPHRGEPYWVVVIDQLDQSTPPMVLPGGWRFFSTPEQLPFFDDRLHYTLKPGKTGLGLVKLGSFPDETCDGEERFVEGAIPGFLSRIAEVSELLQGYVREGAKEKGSLYSRHPTSQNHRDVPAARADILAKIRDIMAAREAERVMIDKEVKVPLSAIIDRLGLPLCPTFNKLLSSSSRPNLDQLLELVSVDPAPVPDKLPTVEFKHQGETHVATLTQEEIDQLVEQIKGVIDRLNEDTGTSLEVLSEMYCSVCLGHCPLPEMMRFNCRHGICLDCAYGDGSPGSAYLPVCPHPDGDNRGCTWEIGIRYCCPECRVPIGKIDPRVDDLFDRHNGTLPPDKRYLFCQRCTNPFEQDAPGCADAIEAGAPELALLEWYCETCRPPPIPTGNCPKCGVVTHKESGCDHITCRCGEHWCWRCERGFGSAGDTYSHMLSGNCRGREGFQGGAGYGF